MVRASARRQAAFTLIEILTVVIIIGVFVEADVITPGEEPPTTP